MSEAFTIQISSELINRLAEDGEKKKTRRSKPKALKQRPKPEPKVHQKQASDSAEIQKVPAPAAVPGWPLQPYLPVVPPPPQPTNPKLEEIRSVIRESERVLERLEKQEQDMVKQVTERARELHEKEFKIPYQKPMPCSAAKDACLSCYKEHLKDPLKCADAVKNFVECARRVRQQTHTSENT